MRPQRYLMNLCLKVSVVLQTRFTRFVALGSVLTLAIVVALYLAGHAHLMAAIFPHAAGPTHAASSVGQQIAGDPWPPAPTQVAQP